ncbi:Uncharacterized conserved protein [Rodentibacter pneumotropicus]|uniref:Uncharacterized conserved protein n=1 Tax=Rodentibacter pneumotropicus TaxID=758 RepID=A0A448MSJ9_9PAST|nr:Uncharacterized conserved protein [Rodentibacter pneumotropicus]
MLDYGEFVESFHLSIQKAEALGLKGEELSAKALEFFQLDCGGVNLYIPKGHISRVGNRKNAIKREFNGTNHAELAKKYGVSIQWVYEILKGNLNNNRKRERTKKEMKA